MKPRSLQYGTLIAMAKAVATYFAARILRAWPWGKSGPTATSECDLIRPVLITEQETFSCHDHCNQQNAGVNPNN
jgi:hypothetical protein